ncbi:MAG: UvrD-helicase domain-containing protein, partial [Planctomycetota bacterium]
MRPVEPPSAPADRAVRREIVGEADRCFVVEAGAGTGKTSLLIERALHLIASQVPLERLAIITFTEKAAGELKIRLRQGIEARLRADPVRDAVYRAALEALDRATISTIHAFAATLLRERPVEARLDPQFRVLDEIEAGVLREETFERHRLESLTREDPDLEEILRHGVSERRVREIAMFAAENRDLSPPPPPPEADPPERLLRRFRERAGRLASLAGSCRDPDDRALRAIRRLHRLAEDLEEAEPRAASLRLLSDGKAPTRAGDRSNWEPRSALEEVRRIFRSLEEDREALLRLTGGRVAWRLGRWIARFTEKYEQALVRQAGLDFQGLLLKARDLVARDRSVRDDFQRRYRYLLVDEFQDTDPLQAEMLFLLAEPRPRAAQWRRAVPAGGRLFIVGDPKQSIYRFRRADIAVYQEARRLLERSGEGGLRRITANFRSVPSLVDWINRLFAPLIGAAADSDLQPAYAPIEASRAPLDDRPAVALLPVPEEAVPRTADAEGARQVEAALVASLLKRIVAEQRWTVQGRDGGRRGAGWEDIALLFRGMTGLGHFEEALRAREIPYRVAGGRTFYTRQETRHLLALL